MKLLDKAKKIIPEKTVAKTKAFFPSSSDAVWRKRATSDAQIIYIFLAGFYQNLGDMAITYAQKQFLSKLYPDAKIITVSSMKTYEAVKVIKKCIKPNDIVTITGGGNMDDTYPSLEDARLHVVKSFPNNRIISFPQTISFSDTPYGRNRLAMSKKIYEGHKNLTMFARELLSYERAKKYFPNVEIGYCPDIVLSLNKFESGLERKGGFCCLRKDKEQSISSDLRLEIIKKARENYSRLFIKDTTDFYLSECDEEHYEQTLEKYWGWLRSVEVVITDRMHCMIFCAITGTPCIVFDNTNHKTLALKEAWLKDLDYIKIIDETDADKVIAKAKEIGKLSTSSSIDLSNEFESLKKACLK